MAGKMEKVRRKLENISKQRQEFSFTAGNSSYAQQTVDERETCPEVIEADILGRDQEKHKVITLMAEASTSSDFIIFPIYGIGGIGKTTLAKLLFNDAHFKDYDKAWVYVSQTFESKIIRDSIGAQLQREQSQLTFTQEPDADPPACKKILIVLDDLWENDDFKVDDLKDSLKKYCSNGRKVHVIVTTRDAGIAQKIQTTESYAIEPLSSDTCWMIIKQKIRGFEDRADKQRLEDIGKEIAMKCKGVALAARSLGYTLRRDMNFDGWVSVRDNDVWNISTSMTEDTSPYDNVLASLKLSYISMLPRRRLCFAYCAIFPKGHKMAKDDLIYQWAALGFIKSSNNDSTWLQHGESIIKQLLDMSFLQHSKSSSDGQHDKDATLFTMHDMVHDLARSIVGDQILDASSKGNIAGRNCRYLSLADCSKPLNSFVTYPDKIRALRFLGNGNIGRDAPRFSSAKYLRVLDLGECSIQKVPSSFGQLKLLRYLNAPGIKDQMIPSCITKLSKLIYLNLRGSSALLALPESIGEMENLMYLNLSDCSEIRELPESFGKLKNLVHMEFTKCSLVSAVSKSLETLTQLQYLNLSYCKNIGEVPVALRSLTRLQYLNLSCSSYFVGMSNGDVTLTNGELLGALSNLKYLNLSSAQGLFLKRLPESLGSFTELEYLNLSGCEQLEELPRSLGNLRNLVHLDLSHCYEVKGIPKALCSLTKLRYLNLSRVRRVLLMNLVMPVRLVPLAELLEAIQKLTELRYLNLSACMRSSYIFYEVEEISHHLEIISTLSNLEHLVLSHNGLLTIPDSLCGLRKLHTLDLTGCSITRSLPESIGNMESLKFLIVKDCRLPNEWIMRINKSSITLPNFVVRVTDGEQSSNLILLKGVTPSELHISSLENVKSVEEAQVIQLREKHSLVKLTLEWTRGPNEGSVEDIELLRELVPPSSLEKFDLQHYRSASFPPWLMDNASHLHNLVSLKLTGLPQCTSLPPLGQLPKLHSLRLEAMPKVTKIDRGFCGGMKAFTRLEELYIHDMESLEEWTTAYSCGKGVADEFMFPNLRSLSIHGCHKLRVIIPCLPRVKHIWSIKESDGVLLQLAESAPHTGSSTPSASGTYLMVDSCMAPMHQWKLLHHLPGLDKLTIDKCGDLSSSSSEIGGVLCSLRELDLNFCDSLVSLPQWLGDLTSLQTLSVWEWPKLNNLLESMRHLTSLQSLSLHHCSGIQALPEWLGDLVFLKKLVIDDVDIMSLPESIGQLTNLERLKIMRCHKLNNFPDSMRQLSSLQSLDLEGCRGIQAVPEWFGDLVSLKELDMHDCVNLLSLPESIQQLTNLETLNIWGCSALEQWCKLEENKMKIGHINQVIPGWYRS